MDIRYKNNIVAAALLSTVSIHAAMSELDKARVSESLIHMQTLCMEIIANLEGNPFINVPEKVVRPAYGIEAGLHNILKEYLLPGQDLGEAWRMGNRNELLEILRAISIDAQDLLGLQDIPGLADDRMRLIPLIAQSFSEYGRVLKMLYERN